MRGIFLSNSILKMNILKLLAGIILLCNSYLIIAQESIDVSIVSYNPDAIKRHCVYLNLDELNSRPNIGYSYYVPTKIYLNAEYGRFKRQIEGNYFFVNTLINAKDRHAIDNNGDHPEKKKRFSIGIHSGIHYTSPYNRSKNTRTSKEFSDPNTNIALIGGISFLFASQSTWMTVTDKQSFGGYGFGRINIDPVFYLYPASNSSYVSVHEDTKNKKQFGWKIYYDGKSSILSKSGHFTITYLLGVTSSSSKTAEDQILPLLNVGAGYSF